MAALKSLQIMEISSHEMSDQARENSECSEDALILGCDACGTRNIKY